MIWMICFFAVLSLHVVLQLRCIFGQLDTEHTSW